MKRKFQVAILLTLVLWIGVVLIQNVEQKAKVEAKQDEEPEIGSKAPGFSLLGLDGRNYSLTAYKGKPVVLNFWASWCAPCKDEAPNLVKLHEKYGSEVQILAVNLTTIDSREQITKFVEAYGFKFPVPLDEEGKAAYSYRIRPIPSTFFIDEQGVIQDGFLGALTFEDFEARTKELLKRER